MLHKLNLNGDHKFFITCLCSVDIWNINVLLFLMILFYLLYLQPHQIAGLHLQPGLVRTGLPQLPSQQILINPVLQHHFNRMPQLPGQGPRLQFSQHRIPNILHRIPVPVSSEGLTLSQPQPPEFIVDGMGIRPPMPPAPEIPSMQPPPQVTLRQLTPEVTTTTVVRSLTPETQVGVGFT